MMADEQPVCTGGNPPEPCMPEPTCPVCGSDLVMWTMLAPGEVECWNPECLATWTEGVELRAD